MAHTISHTKHLLPRRPGKLFHKEYFAKGKRGFVFTARLGEGKNSTAGPVVLVKEKNPEAAIDTVAHEAKMLALVNMHGLGPRFIEYRHGSLIREFIVGTPWLDYLENASKKEIISVLTEIFYQCRKLDLLGLNKEEMTRPYKHIMISTARKRIPAAGGGGIRKKREVVQIDWERCKHSQRPKNVTQFAQCVARGRLQNLLKSKKITIDTNKLISLAKIYKNKYKYLDFIAILATFGGQKEYQKRLTFSERVWEACTEIPRGETRTYKEIAKAIGTRSYQAVGQALRRNPYAPRVPCHRVIASDGSIGGFAGERSGARIKEKKSLLKKEGVKQEF